MRWEIHSLPLFAVKFQQSQSAAPQLRSTQHRITSLFLPGVVPWGSPSGDDQMAQNNPCPPGSSASRVRSYLAEVLGLSPADLRAIAIPLQATLSSATPGTDKYSVPADQELVVFSVQGYLRFNNIGSEPNAIGNSNVTHDERVLIKSQNCLVQLENTDRQYKLFDGRDQCLAGITPPYGAPLYFPVETPMVVPASHNLKATFTLQDVSITGYSVASIYGITLAGVLIPKRS